MTVNLIGAAAAGWLAGWLWCARVLFRRWREVPLWPARKYIGAVRGGAKVYAWHLAPADGAACAAAMLAGTGWVLALAVAAVRWQPRRRPLRRTARLWLTRPGRRARALAARGELVADLERLHLGTVPGEYPPIPDGRKP